MQLLLLPKITPLVLLPIVTLLIGLVALLLLVKLSWDSWQVYSKTMMLNGQASATDFGGVGLYTYEELNKEVTILNLLALRLYEENMPHE